MRYIVTTSWTGGSTLEADSLAVNGEVPELVADRLSHDSRRTLSQPRLSIPSHLSRAASADSSSDPAVEPSSHSDFSLDHNLAGSKLSAMAARAHSVAVPRVSRHTLRRNAVRLIFSTFLPCEAADFFSICHYAVSGTSSRSRLLNSLAMTIMFCIR